MPPKQKGGKKKGKKKDGAGELGMDEKYAKTLAEIEALKDHLFRRKEIARKAKSAGIDTRIRMEEAENRLETQEQDTRMVSADMIRQYKTMQAELQTRCDQLEIDRARLILERDTIRAELEEARLRRGATEREKDERIAQLEAEAAGARRQFAKTASDAFAILLGRIDESRREKREKGTDLHDRHKRMLLGFGINPLDY